METKLKNMNLRHGTILILKKDFPPYPIGTEFTVKYSCVNGLMAETLHAPTFGEKLPNGEKTPSMSVKAYYEYTKIFDKFGGWQNWFDVKPNTEIDEWSSHCIKFKGKELTKDIIEKIKCIVK